MPRKKNESSQKKAYRLWWEYLKLSNDYKRFCEWMDKRLKDSSLPIPKQFNWFELWDGYKMFGNIHVDSFEEWWENNKGKLGRGKEGGFPGPIADYTDFVMIEMEDIIEDFKRRNGKEPSLEQFKGSFLEHLKFPVSRFYFMVSVFGDYRDFEDLGRRFIKIVKEKKEMQGRISKKRAEEYSKALEKKWHVHFDEVEPNKYTMWAGKWQYPTSPLRLDQVERYLQVYNLFAKGPKWHQVADQIEIYQGHKGDSEDVRRAILQDRTNAKTIIGNAEKGIFPGQY